MAWVRLSKGLYRFCDYGKNLENELDDFTQDLNSALTLRYFVTFKSLDKRVNRLI